MPPLDTGRQVPPFAVPRPDKPEELLPAPRTDATLAAPSSQVVQDTRTIGLDPTPAPHLCNDASTHSSGKTPSFASPADNFDDKEHQQCVDPGGSNFKPPRRCKACTRIGLGMAHFPHRPTYLTLCLTPTTQDCTCVRCRLSTLHFPQWPSPLSLK